jgi:hypothetical protein
VRPPNFSRGRARHNLLPASSNSSRKSVEEASFSAAFCASAGTVRRHRPNHGSVQPSAGAGYSSDLSCSSSFFRAQGDAEPIGSGAGRSERTSRAKAWVSAAGVHAPALAAPTGPRQWSHARVRLRPARPSSTGAFAASRSNLSPWRLNWLASGT